MLSPTDTQTLQNWLNGQGNNAAAALADMLESIELDPSELLAAIAAQQLAAEAEELKGKLVDLIRRGLDPEAAARAVADLAEAADQSQEDDDAATP